jgi:diketogulonate reductase-like aldo/keto reductase
VSILPWLKSSAKQKSANKPLGNDDRFPKLPNGERDIIRSHNHVDIWKQMEKLLATGKTKAIGVSNVSFPHFR